MITLRQPQYFSFIGRKDNQEDYLYPRSPRPDDPVFILCDGMGGHERGEVASSTVAETLGRELTASAGQATITRAIFDRALTKAYDALDTIGGADSDRKPGTTLTCLCFGRDSYLAAHIGDSRIYHIRPSLLALGGQPILYRSEDHSLVNELVKAGQITAEEARHHPRRNVITRAMQPLLERRFPATIHESADVCAGDYFFLCSDGVLEQLSDETLCSILASAEFSDAEKMDAIKAECNKGTRDNFTACLIPVATGAPAPKRLKSDKKGSNKSYALPLAILIAIILVAAAGISAYYLGYFKHPEPPTPAPVDTLIENTELIDTIMIEPRGDTPPAAPDTTPAAAPAVTKPQVAPPPTPTPAQKKVQETQPVNNNTTTEAKAEEGKEQTPKTETGTDNGNSDTESAPKPDHSDKQVPPPPKKDPKTPAKPLTQNLPQ